MNEPREGDCLAMMRDELLQQIAALPADADVGIQIGDDHLDIADVTLWGDGDFGALRCNPSDLHDLLLARDLPCGQRQRLAPGGPAMSPHVPDLG